MDPGKGRYGLIMPKKLPQKNLVSKKLSVFADDSDEEPSVGESLQKEALKKQAMKQTKLEIQKALEEDATVYEYDSIYDEMQQKKKESNASLLSGKDDKKPRYIQNILKAAEIRKKEQEKRMERKIQKEREMEGEEFAHKEAFVTSAYKKKLQERAEEEERERREAALEAYMDVTKQKDLSGFYRHLLNQTVGEEEMPKCSFREARIKEEKSDSCYDESNQRNKCPYERQRLKPSVKKENNPDADTDLGTDSSDDDKRQKNSKVNLKKKKRRESSASSEEEPKRHKSQRRSRSPSSSSVEEELRTKAQTDHLAKRGESRQGRRGNDEQYREKDHERSRTHEKDRQREKEERHRYGDHTSKDNYRRREEQDDKQRGKERKEREGHGREWRKVKERDEKDSEKEHEKERIRNGKDRYNDREKERGEKCREKEDHVKERREKYSSDEKKYRERRESTPASFEKDGEGDLEKERKGKEQGLDEKGRSSSGILSEQKHKAGEEGEKEEKEQAQKPTESMSKFAKRSNEETVMSARDRYLARQMARVGTKSYIEKEED
ncbi:PREDICTED: nuclear speckle splicing regulatory protein 1 [Chlamydotis macqueenii]|uniref:nuclear speckle splicing regulatory protein 1 n=1 Tax=Chlamydotis macqueenii TaxID=187382 RepID=UPI0005298A3E|nr:PREDICTED: nuclear speckle splicing regulatory protein 1 [Chlamydotis macqueenii]